MPCGSSSGSDAFVFTQLDTHWWCQDPSVLPHAASVVRGGPPDDNIAHESVSPSDIARGSPTLAASIVFRTADGTQADHSQPQRDSTYTLGDMLRQVLNSSSVRFSGIRPAVSAGVPPQTSVRLRRDAGRAEIRQSRQCCASAARDSQNEIANEAGKREPPTFSQARASQLEYHAHQFGLSNVRILASPPRRGMRPPARGDNEHVQNGQVPVWRLQCDRLCRTDAGQRLPLSGLSA